MACSFTHVTPQFIEEQKVELPIWVPRADNPYCGLRHGEQRACARRRPDLAPAGDHRGRPARAGSTRCRPIARPKPRAGITREKEAELLAAWKARKTG